MGPGVSPSVGVTVSSMSSQNAAPKSSPPPVDATSLRGRRAQGAVERPGTDAERPVDRLPVSRLLVLGQLLARDGRRLLSGDAIGRLAVTRLVLPLAGRLVLAPVERRRCLAHHPGGDSARDGAVDDVCCK